MRPGVRTRRPDDPPERARARAVHGRAVNGGRHQRRHLRAAGDGRLHRHRPARPGAGQDVPLWLAQEGTMRPAGFVHGDGTVLVDGNPAGATAVGLTLEPAEGSARPTTPPLLLLNLPT
ncbi:anti-sigma factor domain-containing protein [Streptomyces lavendofoliae]